MLISTMWGAQPDRHWKARGEYLCFTAFLMKDTLLEWKEGGKNSQEICVFRFCCCNITTTIQRLCSGGVPWVQWLLSLVFGSLCYEHCKPQQTALRNLARQAFLWLSLEGGEKVFICGDSLKGPSGREEEWRWFKSRESLSCLVYVMIHRKNLL